MHEIGIALQIVDIATASIPPNIRKTKVEKVNLRIGRLAAVVPESLRFCFEMAAKNTHLQGAQLSIEEMPGVAKCDDCDTQWTISGLSFRCKKCQSSSVEIISGRKLDIQISLSKEWKAFFDHTHRNPKCSGEKRSISQETNIE